jgi:hypothetical protein
VLALQGTIDGETSQLTNYGKISAQTKGRKKLFCEMSFTKKSESSLKLFCKVRLEKLTLSIWQA